MQYDFIISGMKQNEVQHLFTLNEQERQARGITTIEVNAHPGFPCRISLEDARIGEEVLAFNYEHHNVNSPYRSSGPVFVHFNAQEAKLKKNDIPSILTHRYLSLRTYNKEGMMIAASTVEGKQLKEAIQQLFCNDEAEYIQVHNTKPGCYNCQIDRV